MSDQTGTSARVVATDENPAQLELWAEMAALERERIASRDRMTQVMGKGFDRLDTANERLLQFQRDRLERDDVYRNRVLSQTVKFGWALWGSADQREAAFTWMGVGGALVTGLLIGRQWKGKRPS